MRRMYILTCMLKVDNFENKQAPADSSVILRVSEYSEINMCLICVNILEVICNNCLCSSCKVDSGGNFP